MVEGDVGDTEEIEKDLTDVEKINRTTRRLDVHRNQLSIVNIGVFIFCKVEKINDGVQIAYRLNWDSTRDIILMTTSKTVFLYDEKKKTPEHPKRR